LLRNFCLALSLRIVVDATAKFMSALEKETEQRKAGHGKLGEGEECIDISTASSDGSDCGKTGEVGTPSSPSSGTKEEEDSQALVERYAELIRRLNI
jgi:hypothetical protein